MQLRPIAQEPLDLRQRSRDYFNLYAPRHNIPPIDLRARVDELTQGGTQGLNNGLTLEENHRLFATPSLFEQVSLVLRGLRNVEHSTCPAR